MKTHLTQILVTTTLLLALGSAQAADSLTRFGPMPGSTVRIEGTSTVHDWQVVSHLVGGSLEAGPNFPTEPGEKADPGKVNAKADVFIPVRSLTSIEKDGQPYSTSMDDIMYGKLLQEQHPRIVYHLNELVLKESPKAASDPYVFDSKGDLIVAGVTNAISMPVNVTPLGGKKLKISGSTPLKMTDFKITPPAPAVALGLIKVGDEVTIKFEWMVQERKPAGGS